ncbi:MAG: hypothetical protein Q4G22_09445 [Paracoccus sp. (in: a-proteobacteria)]|uniref:baeRF8 domain-containing protein n=1 Tax=Paracoccus sp. TaxID=267 RepID=UPI0026DEFCBB|nr:hypothetical protein [Paracoccus sp. (in: a-proteobacteria)]MDO5632051.1 hypothetical protein [Paracoccus sp. (in: a-proteobacteria)]
MLYLDIPTQTQIDKLADTRSLAAVSIYLAATPLTQDADLTRISLKNHAREAITQLETTQLETTGADKRDVQAISEQLAELDEDTGFWAYQAYGLALFVTPERLRIFRLANRLTDSVHVADRFHLKPLLRATSFSNSAFVLALAENSVRLIDVPAEGATDEVDVPGMPKDAYDALGLTETNERSQNTRIHGSEGKEVRHRQYVRAVDKALHKLLGDSERPLIVAAADPLRHVFTQQSDYPGLASETIQGNPEHKTPAQLAEAARPIMEGLQKDKIEALHDLYETRANEGRASADLATIARAAVSGAVQTLLVDMDKVVPGILHEDGAIQTADAPSAETYGLTDQIALKVRAQGGRVLSVRADDLPDAGSPVAAILRWAV